jgi:hypothetical protein
MKNLAFFIIISGFLLVSACKKDDKSERFIFLTTPVWTADSLLANKVDASGPGDILEKFRGDAKFREDGTGYFGIYKGTWRFNSKETELSIIADTLGYAITTNIVVLTASSLKVTTLYPNMAFPDQPINIRMTFKAK